MQDFHSSSLRYFGELWNLKSKSQIWTLNIRKKTWIVIHIYNILYIICILKYPWDMRFSGSLLRGMMSRSSLLLAMVRRKRRDESERRPESQPVRELSLFPWFLTFLSVLGFVRRNDWANTSTGVNMRVDDSKVGLVPSLGLSQRKASIAWVPGDNVTENLQRIRYCFHYNSGAPTIFQYEIWRSMLLLVEEILQ